MHWKVKPPKVYHPPRVGDTRVRIRFALFPVKIREHHVWLEFYWVLQQYDRWPHTFVDSEEHEGEWYEKRVDGFLTGWKTVRYA